MKKSDSKPSSPETVQQLLARSRICAPEHFTAQVMEALPGRAAPARQNPARVWWPSNGEWLLPALVGAMAMLFIWLGVSLYGTRPPVQPTVAAQHIMVSFELHAPDARRVELAGSFNDWEVGAIELSGPDATGNWTVELPLPEGRHEYLFLVDGKQWIADPMATAYRDDGFGLRNAVLEL